jgi:hypothetical protein
MPTWSGTHDNGTTPFFDDARVLPLAALSLLQSRLPDPRVIAGSRKIRFGDFFRDEHNRIGN